MNLSKPNIIYVDDESLNLVIGKSLLETDFNISVFQSPSDALNELKTIKPCVIISDLKMPNMNGVEFLELAQQIYPDAVRIILTGNSDETSVIDALRRAGIFNFLKKPLGKGDLKGAVDKAYQKFLVDEEERVKKQKAKNPDLMEHPSWLHKIAEQLNLAFSQLPQYRLSAKQVESWSILIHLAMSADKRYYHNTHHLFDIWDVKDPFEQLAILFHDVVYAQVDKTSGRGLLPQIVSILSPILPNSDLKITLPPVNIVEDPNALDILYRVFGVKEGDILTHMTGMNEFLSARVAQKVLGTVMSSWDIIQIVSCIELTIPFRVKDKNGLAAPDRLLERLTSLNQDLSLQVKSLEIEKALKCAVDVSNRDLWSFAAENPGAFLNGSWQLILEGNILLQKELHSPKDYRIALEKMEGFLGFLKPDIIFQRIGNFPNEKDYANLLSKCHFNLEAGRTYFQAKLLAMGIFEALDDLSGGGAPIEIFRGDIESETNPDSESMSKYLLLTLPQVSISEVNRTVLDLLKITTEARIRYDLKNSPLAFYVYSRLTKNEFNNLIKAARSYFKDELEAFDLLKSFPRTLIVAVIKAICEISKSRKTDLLQIQKLLESIVELEEIDD